MLLVEIFSEISGVDPGFPVGGGSNPPGGRQHMILPNFAKNCMKLRTFWAVGGRAPGRPLSPPLDLISVLDFPFLQLNYNLL